ncbi:MAG: membrane protein insertion efficiency factor YidD [Comamonadaceae bacterium]|nr:membrane protein insertion efficiency factor YidD [Comamonadaceae bacterium]
MKTLLLALLRAYRYLLSPWVGGSCRYWPTCSEYAREAIETHGAARGSYMTLARLARCHPYGARWRRPGAGAVPLALLVRRGAGRGRRRVTAGPRPVAAARTTAR